jgi:ubiquinone/menaquinone biosynthesis C-methylase UbiE
LTEPKSKKPQVSKDWVACKQIVSTLKLTPNSQILDVGSKDGEKTHYLFAEGQILMSDISKKGLSPFVLSDATKLPYNDNSFDLVTILHVIEHIKNDREALKEIYRVLKKEGTVLIVTPNESRFTRIFSVILRTLARSPPKYPLNPDHVLEYSAKNIENLMKQSEFGNYKIDPIFMRLSSLIRIRKYCDQWIIIAKK